MPLQPRHLVPGLLLVLLGGCASTPVTDTKSPYYVPTPGSRVVVHQRLEVPPETRRVFLQFGKIVAKHDLDEYYPNCDFEIASLAKEPRYIEPGTYTVTRVQQRVDSIVSNGPVMVAALDTARLFGGMDSQNDGLSSQFEEVRMFLKSDSPSELRKLSCRGAIAEPVDMVLPTLADMRRALGDFASLAVPEEKTR